MNTPTLNPSHPTQQYHLYATSNTLVPTAAPTTGPGPRPAPGQQHDVKPSKSTSVNTLVPIDIEENNPNSDGRPLRRNRNRNRKPRSRGLKAIRKHKLAVITRCFLISFSIAVLAYVAWIHKHWVEERKLVGDDESYEGGYVATTMAITINLLVFLLIVVGYYGGDSDTPGKGLGLFGDLCVVGVCIYGFIDFVDWSMERRQTDIYGNPLDDETLRYKDDEEVAAWLCLGVGIAHFINMIGNCFKACAGICGGGRRG